MLESLKSEYERLKRKHIETVQAREDVVLIAGGAGGIGSSICEFYEGRGHKVIVLDVVEPTCAHSHFIKVDIRDIAALEQARNEIVDKYGQITHLINVTGGCINSVDSSGNVVDEFHGLANTTPRLVSDSIGLNLIAPIHLVQTFLPLFTNDRAKHPSVVLTSSINAVKDYGSASYSASKAGLYGFVKAMATELGDIGIRINTVSPGTVVTPRTASQPKDWDFIKRGTALGKLTVPLDVAKTVFAMTHLMPATTGQDVIVDAGQTVIGGLTQKAPKQELKI